MCEIPYTMKKTIALLFLSSLCATPNVSAQVEIVTLQKESGLENQTRLALATASELLDENPPAPVPSSLNRQAAMHIIDGIFHDTRFDGSSHIKTFVDNRCQGVLESLSRPLESRAEVHKLYNSGMIVRTPNATIAFDICRGAKSGTDGLIADSTARAIVEKCDILFLTHNHPDHVDPTVARMFLEQGKPVVAPDEVLPNIEGITHDRDTAVWHSNYTLKNGETIAATILPGHQDHLHNNIYILTTPDGFRIAFTGDQWLKADEEWLFALEGKIEPVDLLMPICWARNFPQFVNLFSPSNVVSIHENEIIFHGIDHRESYWLSEAKLRALPVRSYLLTIGETLPIK